MRVLNEDIPTTESGYWSSLGEYWDINHRLKWTVIGLSVVGLPLGFVAAGAFGVLGVVFIDVLAFLLTPKIATKVRRERSGVLK